MTGGSSLFCLSSMEFSCESRSWDEIVSDRKHDTITGAMIMGTERSNIHIGYRWSGSYGEGRDSLEVAKVDIRFHSLFFASIRVSIFFKVSTPATIKHTGLVDGDEGDKTVLFCYRDPSDSVDGKEGATQVKRSLALCVFIAGIIGKIGRGYGRGSPEPEHADIHSF